MQNALLTRSCCSARRRSASSALALRSASAASAAALSSRAKDDCKDAFEVKRLKSFPGTDEVMRRRDLPCRSFGFGSRLQLLGLFAKTVLQLGDAG